METPIANYLARLTNSGLKFTGPNGEDLSISALLGPAPPLNSDGQPVQGAYGLRPTPITVAVHKHLASLANRSSSSGLTHDSALLLGYIQSLRLHKQSEDENSDWEIGSKWTDTPEKHQDASKPQPAVQKRQENLLSRHSLIHNLLSRLPQDTDKA